MTEINLKSGKKILIKNLSIDKIDELKDKMEFVQYPDGNQTIKGVAKHRTAWIRSGICGIGDWRAKNGEIAPDEILKTLSDDEKNELLVEIQKAQIVNPMKPSSLR